MQPKLHPPEKLKLAGLVITLHACHWSAEPGEPPLRVLGCQALLSPRAFGSTVRDLADPQVLGDRADRKHCLIQRTPGAAAEDSDLGVRAGVQRDWSLVPNGGGRYAVGNASRPFAGHRLVPKRTSLLAELLS